MKLEEIKSLMQSYDAGTVEVRDYIRTKSAPIVAQLLRMLEVATTTLKAIAADPETYEGILANKCLAELKRSSEGTIGGGLR